MRRAMDSSSCVELVVGKSRSEDRLVSGWENREVWRVTSEPTGAACSLQAVTSVTVALMPKRENVTESWYFLRWC